MRESFHSFTHPGDSTAMRDDGMIFHRETMACYCTAMRNSGVSIVSKVASSGDVELILEKQATPISLPKNVFWPLISITEVVADGNCGFRAVAHIVHGQESEWPKVRQHLFDHLNGDPEGYLCNFVFATVAEISLQSLPASLMHFVGPTWDHSKWFELLPIC